MVTPYNLLVLVAAVVLIAIGAVVYVFGSATAAAGYVALATPLLVVLTSLITAYQNSQNHQQNSARLDDLESKVK